MPYYSEVFPTNQIITNQMLTLGFLWRTEIIWDKRNYGCNYTTWGSWMSPSNPFVKTIFEYINVYCKGSFKKIGSKENIDISKKEFIEYVNGIWRITPETRMSKFGHPAVFPEEIPKRLMKLFSYKGDIVLDPFNGVGTTTLVAKKLGRGFIGIDLSPEYCKTARNRLNSLII